MAQFYELSSVNWTPYGSEYYNRDRAMSAVNDLVDSDEFIDASSLSGILDLTINHDTIFYLTDKKITDDIFSNKHNTSAFELSSLPLSTSTFNLGTSGSPTFVDYHYCPTTPQFNRTTDFKNIYDNIPINHIMYSPFRSSVRHFSTDPSDPFADELDVFQFNLFSLKNTMTPTYEYGNCEDVSIRDYKKIYTGTNQRSGLKDIFFGYNSSLYELKFPSNEVKFFHYPYDGVETFLSASCLFEGGARPGDCPLNSDIICFDNNIQGFNLLSAGNLELGLSGYLLLGTGNGVLMLGNDEELKTLNGQFVCAWLSGSNTCSCSSQWMERWYDPDTVMQGDQHITAVNAGSCESIWDVPSSMKLIPKRRYSYDRYGDDRNNLVVGSLSSNLVLHFEDWEEELIDMSPSENNGYILESYDGPPNTFVMDGSVHAHIPPSDSILSERGLTVSVGVLKEDWCCGKNSQMIGNYYFGGWGLFYNTGMGNNIISVGDSEGSVYSFNIEGTKIFEKYIEDNQNLDNVSIDYFATDLNGARWILDTFNHKLYKIDVDDLLLEVVNYPESYNVKKLQVDPDNNVLLHDRFNDKVFVHDEVGNYITSYDSPSTSNNFEIGPDGVIVYDTADLLTINNDGIVYKSVGSNLYKDGEVLYHFNDIIMDMKLDNENNLWIVYCGNILIKINDKGEMVLKKEILSFLAGEKSTKIGITREAGSDGCDENVVWLVFEHNKHIVKLNTLGRILDVVNADDSIIGNVCTDFKLRACGDFTGFDVNRKYETAGGKHITPDNPAFTLRIKFTNPCGTKLFKFLHMPVCNLDEGWHNVSFTYDADSGVLRFFLDGGIHEEIQLDKGIWSIDYNVSSPIIIGGNSGKLGSENVEKSIIGNQYFTGEIDCVRVYNKALSQFLVGSVSDIKLHNFDDLSWNVPILQKSLVEKVDRFFMNKKPGHTTKYFNLKINGFDVDRDLQLLIEDAIRSSINNMIPEHTELKGIVWE